jgi:hypothetical protein
METEICRGDRYGNELPKWESWEGFGDSGIYVTSDEIREVGNNADSAAYPILYSLRVCRSPSVST